MMILRSIGGRGLGGGDTKRNSEGFVYTHREELLKTQARWALLIGKLTRGAGLFRFDETAKDPRTQKSNYIISTKQPTPRNHSRCR